MTKTIPTDDQLIGELIDSFGNLWECEPPMHDCFREVVSKEVSEDKILRINHPRTFLKPVARTVKKLHIQKIRWRCYQVTTGYIALMSSL